MKAVTREIEFRGCEDKTFRTDDGKDLAMKVYRFEDEAGNQNEFYVMAYRVKDVPGLDTLVRGSVYNLELSIGKFNKVRLIGVYETTSTIDL